MSKRANGEGTIYQRKDGRWAGEVSYISQNGEERRKFFYGKSQQEILDKIKKFNAEVEGNRVIEPQKLKVGEWLLEWLELYKKPHIRPKTYEQYEAIIRVHINPQIGKQKLQQLQSRHIQRIYHALANQKLSPRTIYLVHLVLRMALDQAVKERIIHENPVRATIPPKVKKKTAEVLSIEEQDAFLKALKGERLAPIFLFLITTGVRRGEALGLKWSDIVIDMDGNMTAHIRRSVVRAKDPEGEFNTKLFIEDTKTEKSKREIPLLEFTAKVLKAHKVQQNKEKLKAGSEWEDSGFVFSTRFGGVIEPSVLYREFRRILKKAGLEGVKIHTLRHTFATRLLELGTHPKVVQELLGHEDISTTLNIYSHVSPEIKRRAAEKLDTLFTKENIKESIIEI